MAKWLKVFGVGLVLLLAGLGVNELLLTKARHLKTIVDDADLWSLERRRVNHLGEDAVVMLGASRMQGDIDLSVLQRVMKKREVVQLAVSGGGSSYAVFEDIVTNTSFAGLILIDETQMSLADGAALQVSFVDHFHQRFSLDREVNKRISMLLQGQFLFLNPNSNSERLWGNLLVKRSLPPPMFTLTAANREQSLFFDLTDTRWLYNMRIEGIRQGVKRTPMDTREFLSRVEKWKTLIDVYQRRGGTVVFVHLPVSSDRWDLEDRWMPKRWYWDEAMIALHVPSLHFADYPDWQGFRLPDTSHLDSTEKGLFTERFSRAIVRVIYPKN